jgi:hypothetical protein
MRHICGPRATVPRRSGSREHTLDVQKKAGSMAMAPALAHFGSADADYFFSIALSGAPLSLFISLVFLDFFFILFIALMALSELAAPLALV